MDENVVVQTQLSEKLWTIPNILSIFRIILVIPIVQQLGLNNPISNFIAFVIFAVALLTDFLDGFLARALKSVSKIGYFIDPMGDKILAVTISALLYFSKRAPFYFFFLIVLRDLIISIGALYALNTKKKVVQPLISGKVTAILLGLTLGFYLLKYSFINNTKLLHIIFNNIVFYGTILTSIFLVLSGIIYGVNYYKAFMIQKAEKN